MALDQDIYITADLVIEECHEDALDHALGQIKRFIDDDDAESAITWSRILTAIIRLQCTEI